MNHNPIPTENLHIQMVKIVPLSEILEAIGHPDMGNDGTDAFADISFGDAAYTLCSAYNLFCMIDRHLESEDDGMGGLTYTGEQSDRIRDFLIELQESHTYIDMES